MVLDIVETECGKFCLLEKDLISVHIRNYGNWESHLIDFYRSFIKPDDIIIDCGANLGFHTIQFGNLARDGRVYSFEPQPLLFNILNLNILLNELSSIIRPLPFGVSDTVSRMRMSPVSEQIFSPDLINYGGRSIIDTGDGEDIDTIVLDQLFENKNMQFSLIKLDIQGHELKAIQGAKNIINKNRPIIMFENSITEPYVNKDREVLSLLKTIGYEIYRVAAMNNEDCIALDPIKHKTQIEFLQQDSYKYIYI